MISVNLVDSILSSLKTNWESAAFSNYQGSTVKYKEVADRIMFLHNLFKQVGVRKGDKVSLLGKNSINWAISYLATITYGAVIVPILPDFKPGDVHHIVNHSDSCILFAEDSLWENLEQASMPSLQAVFTITDYSAIFLKKPNLADILQKTAKSYSAESDDLQPDDLQINTVENRELAAIVYTSGTTGFSKGVMLTHNNLMSNIDFAQHNMPLEPGDRIVSFLPIAHVFGCVFEFLFPVTCGCHITFLSKIPSPKVIVKAFQEVHPRLILSVPLVIEKIYKKQIKPALDKPILKILSHLPPLRARIYKKVHRKLTTVFGGNFREIVIGGAALNEEVEDFLRKIKFRYTVGYGMTECAPLISYAGWSTFKSGSTGKIVDNMQVRIDSTDPHNEVGEIQVKGENVMSGYYKNDEATRETLQDGWLRTGDLGIIDRDNFIYIKGRSKSMILGPSGKNIYPEEIEAKLNNLAYVQESIVIERQGKLVGLVYPDMEAADRDKLAENQIESVMEKNRITLNEDLPGYMKVTRLEIYPEEFEKTPKKSIKRFLYST